jgi:signal transduction histidine kinase
MQVAGRQGKPVLEQEFELRFSDGTSRWIFGNAVPVFKPDGTVRGVVATYVETTALKRAEVELGASREELQALTARLLAVREEERTRVAREIHDVLAQELTRLKMDIVWLTRRLGQPIEEGKRPVLQGKLVAMSELTDVAIESVQKIATELRPVVLDSLGLCAAIEWQAKDFGERTGITCYVTLPENDLELERERSTALFRILQESLTNIARYSAATQVEIELQADEAEVTLSVRDNGRGILDSEANNPYSVGLTGMRERASLLGGQCNIAARPGGGTTVEARLPRGAAMASAEGLA